MPNSPNESSPSESERQSQPPDRTTGSEDVLPSSAAREIPDADPFSSAGDAKTAPLRTMVPMNSLPYQSTLDLQRRLEHIQAAQYFAYRRRHIRTSVTLFVLTLLSTFLVGSGFFPLEYLFGILIPKFGLFLQVFYKPLNVHELFAQSCRQGLEYAVPLMTILFCHEMGHYLQSVWNRVPASLPYFIPLPLPPMGTMGAVIFQGRGVATRKQMFDIAVWGPLAGLAVTLPVLWYGLQHSQYQPRTGVASLEFGEPLLVQWMIAASHGPAPEGHVFVLNGIGFAGWVGVLITAMNLLPVGQLDGGHILYTLIGRKAHVVAYSVIALGVAVMLKRQDFSFSLLLLLLMMTGPRHPPTANDNEPLGLPRHILGWLTLSFLIIGFTPSPISAPNPEPEPAVEETEEALPIQAFRLPSIKPVC
jgi:Zn-dependent protease